MRLKLHMWVLAGLLAALIAGCNLTLEEPTPTLPPPTFTPFPQQDPELLEEAPPLGSVNSDGVSGPSPNPNCSTTPANWVTYTVEPGDSLGLLAEQTTSSVSEILAGNCLDNADQLFADTIIYLPRTPVIG
jgi:hypothetical protein